MLSLLLADPTSRSNPRNTKSPNLVEKISQFPSPTDMMEKKDLLGVRKKTALAPAAKRRRKVVGPAKAAGGGRAGGLAKAIAAYLSSDSYMYAPLLSAPPSPPAPSAAPPVSTPEKEVTLVQKYRGSWQATFTAY